MHIHEYYDASGIDFSIRHGEKKRSSFNVVVSISLNAAWTSIHANYFLTTLDDIYTQIIELNSDKFQDFS